MGVPAPFESLLVPAIRAYRLGVARPVGMSDGPSGELFRARGQERIRAGLTDRDHARYVDVRDRARDAVAAAQTGDFEEAERRFAAAEASLAAARAGDELRHLSRSWIDQAYAYLAVRRREWDVAKARLTSAMHADLALETDFDYEIFHIGRVHTLHLWMRALGESGDRRGAVRLGQAIVEYVNGHADTLPIGSGWSRARAAAVPDELKLAMTLRVSSEVGTQLAWCSTDEATAAFAAFPAWRAWDAHPVLSEVHDWAQIKGHYLTGDTRAFLEAVAPFLLAGRRETTLWYAAAHDLLRVCEATRPAATAPFCQDVRGEVAAWRQLPPDVQAPGVFAAIARPGAGGVYRHTTRAKRFHVMTAGLPRTGSTSLHTLFANFRSGNEFMERETVSRVVQLRNGELTRAAFEDYLRQRHDEADLEMDSASFHHLYLDHLVAAHPETRFIMTIRSPYAWANSYIKMIMGWHQRFTADGDPLPQWMEDYGVMLFGDFSWSWVASPDAVTARVEPLADAFVKHWAEANRRALALLPEGRSLLVRTEELSRSVERIARFVGIAPTALTGEHHANAHPDRSDLLQPLGPAWVEARARHYGADVLAVMEHPDLALAGGAA